MSTQLPSELMTSIISAVNAFFPATPTGTSEEQLKVQASRVKALESAQQLLQTAIITARDAAKPHAIAVLATAGGNTGAVDMLAKINEMMPEVTVTSVVAEPPKLTPENIALSEEAYTEAMQKRAVEIESLAKLAMQLLMGAAVTAL